MPVARVSRGRLRRRGQAMVEFAIALPIMLALIALSMTGEQLMTSAVGLGGAARAGAMAAASDVNANANVSVATELADATAAVNAEEGCSSCFTGVSGAAACPAGTACVWVTRISGSRSGSAIEVIDVSRPIVPYVPLIKTISVTAHAASTP